MNKLKTILQYKYLFLGIFLLTIIYVFYNINYIKKESKYNINEKEFILEVKKIKYKEDNIYIEFKGKEKLITYYDKEFNYQIGDIILIKADLNSINSNNIPNTFNYKNYLYYNNIFYNLKIYNITLLKKNSNIINSLKNNIINKINKISNNQYLYAYILGDNSYINSDIKNTYKNNGLSHVIAVSGLHISLITILVNLILKRLKFKDNIIFIITTSILMLFLVLTDYLVSVIRSVLMYILCSLNKKLNLNIKSYNILLLICSISLIINPYLIYNLGFIYSYSISFSLIYFNKLLQGNFIKSLIKVSTLSFLISIPINIYFNYEINIINIVINILLVPVFSYLVFPLSILTFIVPKLSLILEILTNTIEDILVYTSNINLLKFTFRKPNLFIILIYYLIIYLILKKNKKFIITLIIMLLFHHNINNIINETFISFLDVNQGDSILIKSNNKLFLIDTGGGNKDYSNQLKTYINSLGFNKIDYLILTHGDSDHLGSANNLIEIININNIILNKGDFNHLEQEIINKCIKNNINYQNNINKINLNNINMHFINDKIYDNENDNSIVIYITCYNKKILLMGDASTLTEQDIINKYNLNNVDILKVGHHGSNTSTSKSLVNKVNPKISIISVGLNNRYKHPNKEVLDTLKNSMIYRTDELGTIIFKLNN